MKSLQASKKMKKTKAGMIPVDWEVARLEDVAHIQTGIAKNQKKIQDTVELPYIRVANVQDGYLDLSTILKIKITENKINRYLLQKKDLLLVEGNGNPDNLGRCAIWSSEIEQCVHQNHIFVIRIKKNYVYYSYLFFQMQSYRGRLYFRSCSKSTSGLATINSSQLKAFPVILPSFSEQKTISDLLSTWDEVIDKTERLIWLKEKRFKGLLYKLISEPSLDAENYKWEKVKLGDVFKLGRGRVISKQEIESNSGDFPVYSSQTANNGILGNINTYDFEGDYITWTTDGANAGTVFFRNGKFNCTNVCGMAKPLYPQNVCPKFVAYQVNMYAKRYVSYVGNPKLMNNVFSEIVAYIPSLKKQHQIAEILSIAQEEIDLRKKMLEKYKTQKWGLMQMLLTGEWRVQSGIIKKYEEE